MMKKREVPGDVRHFTEEMSFMEMITQEAEDMNWLDKIMRQDLCVKALAHIVYLPFLPLLFSPLMFPCLSSQAPQQNPQRIPLRSAMLFIVCRVRRHCDLYFARHFGRHYNLFKIRTSQLVTALDLYPFQDQTMSDSYLLLWHIAFRNLNWRIASFTTAVFTVGLWCFTGWGKMSIYSCLWTCICQNIPVAYFIQISPLLYSFCLSVWALTSVGQKWAMRRCSTMLWFVLLRLLEHRKLDDFLQRGPSVGHFKTLTNWNFASLCDVTIPSPLVLEMGVRGVQHEALVERGHRA